MCVCLSVCVRKRVRVSVCVQTRSRPSVPENSTAKAKMLSFFTPGTDPKVSTTFQSKSGGDGVLFEKKRRSKELPEDETFSCRNGRWKEPWKVEGRRVCENQTRQVPVHCRGAATVRRAVRAARQCRVRQERRSLAQSLGGLGLLPLTYSPRLVPSFTGTQSVAQALGICTSALGAAGKSRLGPAGTLGGGGRREKKETKDEGGGGLGMDPHGNPSKRLAGGVFAEC